MNQFRRFHRRPSDNAWAKWTFIGIVVAGALAIGARAYLVHRIETRLQDIVERSQAQSRQIQQQQRERQAALAHQQQEKVRQEAEAKARAARKEAAWNKYFQPSPKCLDDPINVACANAHIRAKKKFEESYRDPL